jgi:cation:H+ antiporter
MEGTILLAAFILYLFFEMRNERHSRHVHLENLSRIEKQFLLFATGAAVVILGSMLLVNSAIDMAEILNVPQSIIGLTAVAFGTSLPELATALTAVRKGYYEMAAGELIGSNITNILFALGLASIISPISVDIPSMMVGMMNVMLIAIILALMGSRKKFTRFEGVLLLLIYLEFLWVGYGFV